MKNHAFTAILLLCTVCTINLYSQDKYSGLVSPVVSGINAETNGSEIILSWRDAPVSEDTIYEIRRSNMVITDENLFDSDKVANIAPGIRTYTDKPGNSGSWWYAVVSIRNGQYINLIIPWRNALGIPVTIQTPTSYIHAESTAAVTISNLRSSPLPLLRNSFPEKKPLSSGSTSVLSAVLNSDRGKLWINIEPEILDIDRGSSEKPGQIILKEILDDSFAGENWEDAEKKLFALSAAGGLDKAQKARILFYSGQCQYFQNNLQSAFLSFLAASDYYYLEARRWMLVIYGDLIPVS